MVTKHVPMFGTLLIKRTHHNTQNTPFITIPLIQWLQVLVIMQPSWQRP